MRNFDANKLIKEGIKPHQILFVSTFIESYEGSKEMILHDIDGLDEDYLYVEGGHCSCYGFDEVCWEGTVLNSDELRSLVKGNLERDSYYLTTKEFWIQVDEYLSMRVI